MAFAFLLLAFVFKFSVMQKKKASFKEVEKSDYNETGSRFLSAFTGIGIWYLAKTEIIPHPGEYSHESLNFNNQTKNAINIFEGFFILRRSSEYFLTGLSLGRAKRAGPVLSPDPHSSPVNSAVLLCWHQHSCSSGVTRLKELI